MFSMVEEDGVQTALARLDEALDALDTLPLTGHSDEQVLELLSGLEERRRRLASVDHAIISEIDERGLAASGAVNAPAACSPSCCGSPPVRRTRGCARRRSWRRGGV